MFKSCPERHSGRSLRFVPKVWFLPCLKVNSILINLFLLYSYFRPSAGGVLDWKARISIRTVSQGDDSGHGQIEGRSEGKSFAPRLCYACHTHLTSKSSRTAQAPTVSAVPLPTWTESRMIGEESSNGEIWKTTPLSDEGMKRSIGEFLLEE